MEYTILLKILAACSIFCSIVIWAAFNLQRDAERVHGKLADFKSRAVNAVTRQDLVAIHNELVRFANSTCWHRSYGGHAVRIVSYIKGRIDSMDRFDQQAPKF